MSDRNSTQELTEMQAAFAMAFVTNGGNGTQAAIEAGYSKDSARQQAHALVSKPHVQKAIQAEQRRTLARLANKSIVVLEGFLDDANAPAGVRLDAAKTILDRAGLTSKAAEAEDALTGKRLNEMSIEELEAFIARGEQARPPPDSISH
jgi:phage terminase small subunit